MWILGRHVGGRRQGEEPQRPFLLSILSKPSPEPAARPPVLSLVFEIKSDKFDFEIISTMLFGEVEDITLEAK